MNNKPSTELPPMDPNHPFYAEAGREWNSRNHISRDWQPLEVCLVDERMQRDAQLAASLRTIQEQAAEIERIKRRGDTWRQLTYDWEKVVKQANCDKSAAESKLSAIREAIPTSAEKFLATEGFADSVAHSSVDIAQLLTRYAYAFKERLSEIVGEVKG